MIRTEPCLPENPIQPPQSTAVGMLDLTPNFIKPVILPGIPLNDDLQVARQNYTGTFDVSSSAVAGTEVFACEPLSYWRVDDNFPDYIPPSWSMNTRCADFGNLVPTLTFQAVKVRTAPCQIRCVWKPPNDLPVHLADFCPSTSVPVGTGGWDDHWLRNPLFMWDLSVSDTFTIQFPGIRNYELFNMRYTAGSGQTECFMTDYSAYSVGTMKMEVNLPYLPGSIYPDTFSVNVFKSLSVCDLYVFESYPEAPSIEPNRSGIVVP